MNIRGMAFVVVCITSSLAAQKVTLGDKEAIQKRLQECGLKAEQCFSSFMDHIITKLADKEVSLPEVEACMAEDCAKMRYALCRERLKTEIAKFKVRNEFVGAWSVWTSDMSIISDKEFVRMMKLSDIVAEKHLCDLAEIDRRLSHLDEIQQKFPAVFIQIF